MEVTEPWHFASLRKSDNETSGVIEHDVYEGVWRAICSKITFRLRHMACHGMLELCFDAHRKPRLLCSTLSQTSKKIWNGSFTCELFLGTREGAVGSIIQEECVSASMRTAETHKNNASLRLILRNR